MLTLSAKQEESVIRIRPSEIADVLPAHLKNNKGVEIYLRDGAVLKWNNVSVREGVLSPREGSSEKIAPDAITLIRIKHRSSFRTRRILGGVLGGLAGYVIGATLALGTYDTHGNDGLVVGVLLASPVAGAWAGQRLARGKVVWTTILLAPDKSR